MAYVYINPYKSSYMAAVQELEQRQAELQFLEQRIAQLQETIRVLEPLANAEGTAPGSNLPELCRRVLMSQPGIAFTAESVMQHLAALGVDISGYSNPLAVLHTTLTRLVTKSGSGFLKGGQPDTQPFYVFDPNAASDEYRRKMRAGFGYGPVDLGT
jgi:hypothetical protein